jgi:parvulin-like peptidyl-prolyl isomerase
MGTRTGSLGLILTVLFAAGVPDRAEIIDRVAVVVGNRAIKQSDIERETRIVSFINGGTPDVSLPAQKQVASRLIDQMLIRQEIQTTGATPAAMSDAERLLEQIRKERFPNDSKFREALAHYGITEPELKSALLWQLTVLRFISQRFGGDTAGSDQELVNRQFEAWLEQTRKEARIDYREGDLR